MNLKIILALLCPLLAVSCGKESPNSHLEGQDDKEVSFFGNIGPSTRATDSYFETGDAIGVFAVEKTASNPKGLLLSSNHADNVKYSYSGGMFKGSATDIKQISSQTQMFYKAVYPYSSGLKNEFTFSVYPLLTLKVGSKTYTFYPESVFVWRSGMQYNYDVTVSKDGIISFTSSINPWETDN